MTSQHARPKQEEPSGQILFGEPTKRTVSIVYCISRYDIIYGGKQSLSLTTCIFTYLAEIARKAILTNTFPVHQNPSVEAFKAHVFHPKCKSIPRTEEKEKDCNLWRKHFVWD